MHFLLLSSDKFPPSRVDVKVLFGEEMVKKGHEIDWLLQAEDIQLRAEKKIWQGNTVYVGANRGGGNIICRIRKYLLDFGNDLKALRLASRNHYDFIQVKDKYLAALIGLMTARIYKTKFFFWLSYPFPEAKTYRFKTDSSRFPFLDLIRGRLFSFLQYRVIMKKADHIFVQSEQMKKDLAAKGVTAEKMSPVPMGIKTSDLDGLQPRKIAEIAPDTKVICYLGTMIKVRRLDFLIRSLALIKMRYPGVLLLMVGDSNRSEDLDFLRSEARRLGLEKDVRFTGHLNWKEGMRFAQGADICLSPFYPTYILESTSPTKVVEYMALGRPVVATSHPEQQTLLEKSGGGYCVAYEEQEFADAVCRLLEDTDKAEEMGRRGREYVRAYRDYSIIADRLESIYRDRLTT